MPVLVFPGVLPFSQMGVFSRHLITFTPGALPCHLGPLHMCTFIAHSHFSACDISRYFSRVGTLWAYINRQPPSFVHTVHLLRSALVLLSLSLTCVPMPSLSLSLSLCFRWPSLTSAPSFLQWSMSRLLNADIIAQQFDISRGVATRIVEIEDAIPDSWRMAH